MATTPVGVENFGAGEDGGQGQFVRVIVADTQAIFRAGLRKIFALEDDIRVVGQAETLAQTQSAVARFSADILIFESALAPNPVEWLNELLRQNPKLKVVVVTPGPDEELTLELFRRGAHGVVSREVEPELMVEFGKHGEQILRAARAVKADLIVLGLDHSKHGRLATHLPTTTTYKLVREAHCSVLTVRT